MSSNQTYFEQVGAFLDNELSGDDLASFNQELTRNPDLVNELNYQKELIEGIKDNRRVELKARLDNVQIGNGFWSNPAVKIVSGTVIAVGIGIGIYQISNPSENTLPANHEISELQEEAPLEVMEEISVDIIAQDKDQTIETDQPEELKTDENTEPVENKEEISAVMETPDVPTPEAFEMEDPAEDDLEIPESTLGTEEVPIDSKFEIEIVTNKRKYPFHYQVTDGRLLLYGDFDEEPYELLEISVNTEKKLYLYFKKKYYEIEEGASEITPLQSVSNNSLINELEILRNKES